MAMGAVEEADVARAWMDYFTWAHETFGTVRREHLGSAWTRLRRGLDPQASMVSVVDADHSISAISLVMPDVWDGRTMIIAETTRGLAGGGQLLRATLAGSLAVLDQLGIRLIELEGHSTDVHYPWLLDDLPRIGSDPMDVLELQRR